MNESNNNVVLFDFKNKKKVEDNVVAAPLNDIIPLEEQQCSSNSEDKYTQFVTNPENQEKFRTIVEQIIAVIASEYPVRMCSIGDVLLLKEAVVSLVLRSVYNQDHPFHRMANNLAKIYEGTLNGSTK